MGIMLKGITIDKPNANRRIRITTSNTEGWDYKTSVFPNNLPFNKGQIQKFIGEKYGVPPGEIIWPPYIEVPKL